MPAKARLVRGLRRLRGTRTTPGEGCEKRLLPLILAEIEKAGNRGVTAREVHQKLDPERDLIHTMRLIHRIQNERRVFTCYRQTKLRGATPAQQVAYAFVPIQS
jgi:hypothetical protein